MPKPKPATRLRSLIALMIRGQVLDQSGRLGLLLSLSFMRVMHRPSAAAVAFSHRYCCPGKEREREREREKSPDAHAFLIARERRIIDGKRFVKTVQGNEKLTP